MITFRYRMNLQDEERLLGAIRVIGSHRFDFSDSVCEDLRLPHAL